MTTLIVNLKLSAENDDVIAGFIGQRETAKAA